MTIKIGHRGACGYAPENTLASFQKALDLNVDLIEFDVYICKSGELVVIHDNKVDRTTNGLGFVEEMTLDELQSLDAGNGEVIPTLISVLDLIDKRCNVIIELMGGNTYPLVAKIISDYITFKGWSFENFFVSSFRHADLLEFKKIMPKVKISALIGHLPAENAKFAEYLPFYSLNLDYFFVTKEFVEDAHNKGFKVLVYTVNDEENLKKMKDLGVDGIFSNYPDKI